MKNKLTHREILEKAIQKNCLACGIKLVKKPKQSYKQWERQKYCSFVCNGSTPKREQSIAKDSSNLHKFWRRRIPEPTVCELCREPGKLQLSNRSQEYLNVFAYSCAVVLSSPSTVFSQEGVVLVFLVIE